MYRRLDGSHIVGDPARARCGRSGGEESSHRERSADRAAAGRVRPSIRSPRVARDAVVGSAARVVTPRGVVAAAARATQHLGDRAAHGVLEVDHPATAHARRRVGLPARRKQLAPAPRAGGRAGLEARRRAPGGAAPPVAPGDRPVALVAPRGPGVALDLVQRRQHLRHRVARPVSRRTDSARQATAARRVRCFTRP